VSEEAAESSRGGISFRHNNAKRVLGKRSHQHLSLKIYSVLPCPDGYTPKAARVHASEPAAGPPGPAPDAPVCLYLQHDLAQVAPLLQVAMGRGSLGQRKALVDQHPQLAFGDPRPHNPLHFRRQARLFIRSAWA